MSNTYYEQWADSDYEQNAKPRELFKSEMNRRYGLTEVDSSLQDVIIRMDYVQNVLSKITLKNKSAEFSQLLQEFMRNTKRMRTKLQSILSPFANLEQFSTDLRTVTDTDHSTGDTIKQPACGSRPIDEQT